jgi:hypothetical protein
MAETIHLIDIDGDEEELDWVLEFVFFILGIAFWVR